MISFRLWMRKYTPNYLKCANFMTQKEKQIKLLKASGWKKEYIDGNGIDDEVWIHPTTQKCWLADIVPLPDYFHDLNATHELEKTFADDDAMTEKYWLTLYDVTRTTRWPYDATAAERSEAIGLTLKLWK